MNKKEQEIRDTALKANKAIMDEFMQKTVIAITKPVFEICKGTYLEKNAMDILYIINYMFVNPNFSWFSLRWAVDKVDNKTKQETAVYDNGRRLGIYQGISITIANLFKQYDTFISPTLPNKDKNKPLCRLFKLISDELEDKVYSIFKDLYDKEMAKYNLKPKDLYSILRKEYQNTTIPSSKKS